MQRRAAGHFPALLGFPRPVLVIRLSLQLRVMNRRRNNCDVPAHFFIAVLILRDCATFVETSDKSRIQSGGFEFLVTNTLAEAAKPWSDSAHFILVQRPAK